MNAIDYIYDSGLYKRAKVTLSLEDFLHYNEDGYRRSNPSMKLIIFNELHNSGCVVSMNLAKGRTKVRLK